jgi:hypothetical protein
LGSFCPAPKAPGELGSWNSQFLFPFTHRCYKPNLVEIGSAVPEKKLKMFKSLRMTYDDRRKRITIGHLSDSGDLKIWDGRTHGQTDHYRAPAIWRGPNKQPPVWIDMYDVSTLPPLFRRVCDKRKCLDL